MKVGFCEAIKDILLNDFGEPALSASQYLRDKALLALKAKDYFLAESLLKSLIQRNFAYAEQQPYRGLGGSINERITAGSGIEWYLNRYTELSLYDLLSLCLSFDFSLKGTDYRAWWQEMIGNHPESYKLLCGLANIECCLECHEKAEEYYRLTIKANQYFAKPYQIMAEIEFNKENYRMALCYASECLKREPNNIYAKFIAAKTLKDQTFE